MEGVEQLAELKVTVAEIVHLFGTVGIGIIILATIVATVMVLTQRKNTKDINVAFKELKFMKKDIQEILLDVREVKTKLGCEPQT